MEVTVKQGLHWCGKTYQPGETITGPDADLEYLASHGYVDLPEGHTAGKTVTTTTSPVLPGDQQQPPVKQEQKQTHAHAEPQHQAEQHTKKK